jgi:peptidyl-prolyl cis-trans isomerase C
MEAGMEIRGFELSHGELWRTDHALVEVRAEAPPEARARARALAEELHRRALALPLPRTREAFEQLARSVLADATHRVERLPPIDRSGRYLRGRLLESFARGATQLAQPGDVSSVVETSYGYHVILLIERLPAQERPMEQVRAQVQGELLGRLRHQALERLLEALRIRHRTQVRDEALRAVEQVTFGGEQL